MAGKQIYKADHYSVVIKIYIHVIGQLYIARAAPGKLVGSQSTHNKPII